MLANANGIMHLSINPVYKCNLRCEYCYLTEGQLSDDRLLPLAELDRRLHEITASGHRLGHADIYGGEVLLLPTAYLRGMKDILHAHRIFEIELITNLTALRPEITDDIEFGLSVSYDFEHRELHDHVYSNMLKLSRPFTVLTLATPKVVTLDPDEMLHKLNLLENCHYWEIKPYSTNQANAAPLPFRAFENLVQRLLTSPVAHDIEILNGYMVKEAARGERNSFSDDHVYITPSGRFGVLEFDLNDNEFFQELDSFQGYLDWTMLEKSRVYENGVCGSCEFLGKCLSEHLRKVDSLDDSCNGFYHLIKWGQTHYA